MKTTKHDAMNAEIKMEAGEIIKYSPVAAFSAYSTLHLHTHNYDHMPPYATMLAAAGRLEWLLMDCRAELNGLFTEDDITALLDCYQGDVFSPFELDDMATPLCDHLGIEPDAAHGSKAGELLEKLVQLNPLQRLTLADVLEQTWYRGMQEEKKSPKEFLSSLGIELR